LAQQKNQQALPSPDFPCLSDNLDGLLDAACDAGERWLADGRRAQIAVPPEPGTYFADMLLADVSAAADARNVA
jgi:hypothetical protein